MRADRAIATRPRTTVVPLLFIGALVMGTTELVAVGLVPQYAERNRVSLQAAGGAVGYYALGMFLFGPAITLASSRVGNRRVLLGGCTAFIVGCLLTVFPWLPALYLGRLLSGTGQGVFLAAGFQLIGLTVEEGEQGRRISQVLAGISVAAAVGLPAGTAVGHVAGVVSLAVAAAACAALVGMGLARVAPSVDAPVVAGRSGYGLAVVGRPGVWLRLLGLVLAFVAAFTIVTQLAFVTSRHGVTDGELPIVLLGFGLGAVAGTFTGGLIAAPRYGYLVAALPLVIASALLLYLPARSVLALSLVSAGLAWSTFAVIPAIQTYCTSQGGHEARLLSALPAAAINVGIAVGSVLAGHAIGSGPNGPALAGLAPAIGAAGVLVLAIIIPARNRSPG